ncbi:MAG: accessory Sec system translocase SecA2 [Acidobacteriota bacterium]
MTGGDGPSSARQFYLRIAGVPVEYDLGPYRRVPARSDAAGAASLTDLDLRARFETARRRVMAGTGADEVLAEVYALTREACARSVGLRPFDVQMMAAVALHQGKLAQLATGEGRTLVAVLPAVLNALAGRGVHILTANDYLARRDATWMGAVYRFLGLSVAFVGQQMSQSERRTAYGADVTYVTAKEAGFDFLRDHTQTDPASVVQRPFHYVIVDEADFILIDEARVPLVIAGETPSPGIDHVRIASVVRSLMPGVDFRTDEHERNVSITDAGFRHLTRLLRCGPLHAPKQRLLLSAVHVALHAEVLLHRDRDYIVRNNRIELVDEFTGRVADNRRWPHGIQPAVEAKEGVEVRAEGTVLGSIPIQHFVRLWPRIAGMTATAAPSADEFEQFYGLRTVVFPPNRPCRRVDEPDVIFTHRQAKIDALAVEIATTHRAGRPVLVGTASVAESEELGRTLRRRRIKCHVLNARHDAREALIVARAGMPGAVTISTNMAGRGTDIVLGGGDPSLHAQVVALGGLYVIGTNRHESRRVDDQLRGRAGRQGDPGSSRFFVSLEDDLIRRYGVMQLIPKRHRPARSPRPVSNPIVRREVARAQRIIEGQHFEVRKTLWRYSAMVEEQRAQMCERREGLLHGDAGISVCAEGAPAHHAALARTVGADASRRVERELTLILLDRRWSSHLALIDDIREGIHLQRYGGRNPLTEFQRQIIEAYAAMMEGLRDEIVETFAGLRAEHGAIDLARAGLRGPTSTWTYLINDNPFSSFGLSLLAPGNLGVSMATSVLALMYWPITVVVVAATFVRRRLRRRGAAPPPAGSAAP